MGGEVKYWREYIYKRSRSNFDDFSVLDFEHSFLELLLTLGFEIEFAAVSLRQAMPVAEHQAALAFSSQQAHLLVARKASVAVLLD